MHCGRGHVATAGCLYRDQIYSEGSDQTCYMGHRQHAMAVRRVEKG